MVSFKRSDNFILVLLILAIALVLFSVYISLDLNNVSSNFGKTVQDSSAYGKIELTIVKPEGVIKNG